MGCPLTGSGHCEDHKGTVGFSRWAFGLIVVLLLANLGAIGGTWQQLGVLASQVAVTAQISADNKEGTAELRARVLDLERRSHNPPTAAAP